MEWTGDFILKMSKQYCYGRDSSTFNFGKSWESDFFLSIIKCHDINQWYDHTKIIVYWPLFLKKRKK